MQTDKFCLGCGIKLQTEDAHKEGYAVKEGHTYCQSCFKLMHYGQDKTAVLKHDMPEIKEKGLIVLMTSILHLDQLFAFSMQRHYPSFPVLYVINQVDLLPKSTDLDRFLHNVRTEAKRQQIFLSDIVLMSAIHSSDVDALKSYLKMIPEKNVYLMGLQNSGKTTLFKALTQQKGALAMKKAGLTQKPIVGAFEHLTIYDMPGLYQKGYLHEWLDYETYKKLIPDQTFKPKIYEMEKAKWLHLNDLVSFSHHEDKKKTFVLYLSDFLVLNRRVKPLQKEEIEQRTLKIPKGKHHITFADFGFMHVEGPLTLSLVCHKNLHISLTKALFNDTQN